MLTPDQRNRLVDAILNGRADIDEDMRVSSDIIGSMIGELGTALHTISDRHAEIIDYITSLPDSGRCWAIYGLGKGLHSLDASFRETLLQHMLNMKEEEYKSMTIAGLAEGMFALTESQQNAVFDAALQIEDEGEFSHYVIAGACIRLLSLTPEQQFILAHHVSRMFDEGEVSRSLSSLGPALQGIAGSHYIGMLKILSDKVLLIASEKHKANALAHLGPGLHPVKNLESADGEKHKKILNNIFSTVMSMEREANKSRAIEGLGNALSAFSLEQRNRFIDASLNMIDDINKAMALVGLGKHLEALTCAQKERLIDATLNMTSDHSKAVAIAGLGQTIKFLTSEQQVRLVDATVSLVGRFKAIACGGLKDVKDIQQYGRLVDTALSLSPSNAIVVLPSPRALSLARLTERESFRA